MSRVNTGFRGQTGTKIIKEFLQHTSRPLFLLKQYAMDGIQLTFRLFSLHVYHESIFRVIRYFRPRSKRIEDLSGLIHRLETGKPVGIVLAFEAVGLGVERNIRES